MNYYKLESLQDALRLDYEAEHVSSGPKPRVELWRRRIDTNLCHAFLAWEHGDEVLSERELLSVAEALRIGAGELLTNVKRRGGLWLGPTPPERPTLD